MRSYKILCEAIVFLLFLAISSAADEKGGSVPPFVLNPPESAGRQTDTTTDISQYDPKNPYNIFIDYELGMHCVGFDVSYCCVIPPYNSVQAQVVKSGLNGGRPLLLSPSDGVKLYYTIKDNSYSEGNKMRYWQVLKDVKGNGTMGEPGNRIGSRTISRKI